MDQCFEGDEEVFFILAPRGSSEGFKDSKSIAGPLTHCLCVRGEGEVWVEGDPQYFEDPTQSEVGPLPGDVRV